jgi:integrase
MRVSDLSSQWLAWLRDVKQNSPCTVTTYGKFIGKVLRSCPNVELGELDYDEHVHHALWADDANKNSIRAYIAGWRSFLAWASSGRVALSPVEVQVCKDLALRLADDKPKKTPPLRRFLSEREAAAILRLHPFYSLVPEFFMLTGVRESEFLALKPGDLDAENKVLHIHHGKGDKDRDVTVGTRVVQIWPDVLRRLEDWNFRSSIYQHCRKVGDVAGIPAINVHALRRYYATWRVRRRVPLAHISRQMGHASISQTMEYLDISSEDLAKIEDAIQAEWGKPSAEGVI